MAALDRPIAKDASVDQVAVRPDVDDFPAWCPVLGRDCHLWAWVDAREAKLAALQAQRLRDGHLTQDAHQQVVQLAVAPVVVAEKVVGRVQERPT